MRPRAWMSLILSAGLLAAAAGAAAQQQQQRTRANPAAARTAPARAPQRPAAVASPSLFDRLSSLLQPPAATPATADPDMPQALPVNWAVANRYAQAGGQQGGRAAGFIARNRKAIDSLSVPVLLPGDPDLIAGLRIFPHGDFYTVSSTANGLSFVMTGHAKAYPLPAGAARSLGRAGLKGRIPADGIVIEANDVGLDADFTRFGAVYSIALECRQQLSDPRCKDATYVRGLIARLVVVTPAGRA